jgi:hypothetical protein
MSCRHFQSYSSSIHLANRDLRSFWPRLRHRCFSICLQSLSCDQGSHLQTARSRNQAHIQARYLSRYDKALSKYRPLLSLGERAGSSKQQAVESENKIAVGARMQVTDLTSSPDLNGSTATVVGNVDAATGRWTVRLDLDNSLAQLLPKNLKAIPVASAVSTTGFTTTTKAPTAVLSLNSSHIGNLVRLHLWANHSPARKLYFAGRLYRHCIHGLSPSHHCQQPHRRVHCREFRQRVGRHAFGHRHLQGTACHKYLESFCAAEIWRRSRRCCRFVPSVILLVAAVEENSCLRTDFELIFFCSAFGIRYQKYKHYQI